mmetsp:Transcript_2083/g.4441  ORF Transcript_2083/g.4441 Transcript_2083/m.4441 type:complete len:517 (-) Transcript_2083:140-1690(-)
MIFLGPLRSQGVTSEMGLLIGPLSLPGNPQALSGAVISCSYPELLFFSLYIRFLSLHVLNSSILSLDSYGDFPRNYTWLSDYVPKPFGFFAPVVPISNPEFVPADGPKLSAMYDALLADPGYSGLVKSMGGNERHLGTWDDHDYGLNDGDRTNPNREASKEAFLGFFGARQDDPRRSRDGVYSSTLFFQQERSVLVVVLDLRYSKDPYGEASGDFLGEGQWAWLEETLRASEAQAHVFVSSLPLLSEGREAFGEGWGRFRESRENFLRLLYGLGVKAPVIFSGDVHFAEVLEAKCGGLGSSSSLVEVTSSGLTHSWWGGLGVLRTELKRNMALVMAVFQYTYPWQYQTSSPRPIVGFLSKIAAMIRPNTPDFYLSENFGELEFDWEGDGKPRVLVRILDGRKGALVIDKAWPLEALDMGCPDQTCAELPLESSICTPHKGHSNALRRLLGIFVTGMVAVILLLYKPAFALVWARAILRQRREKDARREARKEREQEEAMREARRRLGIPEPGVTGS